MTLKYALSNHKFSFFFLNNYGEEILTSEWEHLQSEFLSQLAILSELFDNGLANYTTTSYEVDSIDVVRLSDIDKQILGLPDNYPYDIYVESDGILAHQSFKFKYGFYDFAPNGTRLISTRNGATLKLEQVEYLLSENQFLLCQAIDEFNSLPEIEKGNVKNLKKLSDLKSLSNESGMILEQFLNNQELFIPEKIKLDINYANGVLDIIPTVDIQNKGGFIKTFDKFPNIRDIYSISGEDGKTTRVLISDNQKNELGKIKRIRRVSDVKQVHEITEHPELIFNDEEVDTSVFYSERVKEIGIYSPKFYPFVSPYKSQWIPGILIKDKIDGDKKIHFKTPEDLSIFIEEKEKALREGKSIVEWANVEIPIEQAELLIDSSKQQLANPDRPISQNNSLDQTLKTDQEVLIIKENAEFTEFSNGNELPENLKHSFYEVSNLRDVISLKEHQKEGVSWLQALFKEDFAGCLLADDMGLGKTLQLLYFIEWHCQNYDENKPYLIVAPVSLLENWESEYRKFFDPQNLKLNKLYGGVSLTKEHNPAKNRNDAKNLQQRQIILTNYETLRTYQISLGLVDFAIVALDEAQKIKTPGTLITNASKALKADFKIAMTGTPVENTLVDIWCIMDFAVPGLLGNAKDFANEYQKPLKDTKTDVKILTEKLRNNIGVFIKRRLKSDVAKDLPIKYDNENSVIKRPMPSAQFERYNQEIEMANNSILESVEKRNQALKSLSAIRDISDHPYIIDRKVSESSSETLISTSSKLQVSIEILEKIRSKNEKVIVFADRKETQKMLQKVMYDTFGIFASIINGDTPTTRQLEDKSKLSRQQTIDRFQLREGFNVIIMSPIAAGVGLNVTQANHIIHYSRHWNPAKEEQATDRAYRIGQEKDVYVYYPMAVFPEDMKDEDGNRSQSFDEVLDALLHNKKVLARNTLFPTEQAEVTPDELLKNVLVSKHRSKATSLTLEEIDRLHPNLFEACIASLYKKQGFEVYLTPYSNDKGGDIVALRENENYLIQVKQTKSTVGNNPIQEICTAKSYYEAKFIKQFMLVSITNSNYTPSAITLAEYNKVILLNREHLKELLIHNDVTIQDINQIESQRMSRV